jgi:hypothetical protein
MRSLLILISIFLVGCSKEVKPEELSEEFVLIEFASKLEEDFERLDQANSKEKK